MKNATKLLFLIAIAIGCNAQKLFVNVSSGLSIPISEYKNSQSALTRFYVSPSVGYMFSKNIGAQASFIYSNNSADEKAYFENYKRTTINFTLQNTLSKFNWINMGCSIGPVISFYGLRINPSVGLSGLSATTTHSQENNTTISIDTPKLNGLLFSLDLGYIFKINNHISAGASVMYMNINYGEYKTKTTLISTQGSGSSTIYFNSNERKMIVSELLAGILLQINI